LSLSRKTRVVLDTNVLVSGILFENGKEARILRSAANGGIGVFASVDILAEFVRVISRPKFQLTTLEVSVATEYILSFAKFTLSPEPLKYQIRDPEDLKFLECVRQAKAHYLVTGDKDLLTLGRFDRAMIVTPSEFGRQLGPPRS
jgi:putative PIN family toxin of toxin-antitoxin system